MASERGRGFPESWKEMLDAWRQHIGQPAAEGARLLTLEGTDGNGKSHLVRALSDRLEARGIEVLAIGEPGTFHKSHQMAELSRSMAGLAELMEQAAACRTKLAALDRSDPQRAGKQLEIFLEARSIAWHIQEGWLERHPRGIVLRDRGWPSTLTHQFSAVQGSEEGVNPPAATAFPRLREAGEKVLLLRWKPTPGNFPEDSLSRPKVDLDFSDSETAQRYIELADRCSFILEPEEHRGLEGRALESARCSWAQLQLGQLEGEGGG